jgi:5-methylcytosine-specific restriction endonuclease McrA
MVLLLKGVVQAIEFWPNPILSAGGDYYQVPKIVMVKKYVKRNKRFVPNKRNVFLRDNYTCQYCGCEKPEHLTLDHVLPQSRNGRNTWENLVCACRDCNFKKGNRTPEEAMMPLLRKPTEPGHS